MSGVVLPTWTDRFLAELGEHMNTMDAEIAGAEEEGGEALEPYLQYGTTPEERHENFCMDKYDEYRSTALATRAAIPGLKAMGDGTIVFPKDTTQEDISRYQELTKRQMVQDLRATCFRIALELTTPADIDFITTCKDGPDELEKIRKRVDLVGSQHCAFEGCKKQGVVFCKGCDSAGYCSAEHFVEDDKHTGMECQFAAYVVEAGHVKEWARVLRGESGTDAAFRTKEKRFAGFRDGECAADDCSQGGCTKACVKCKEAHYCHKEHQTADWKAQHKDECRRIVEAKETSLK